MTAEYLAYLPGERRLMAAFFREPEILVEAARVELDDFTDPHCQACLMAFRNMQHKGFPVAQDATATALAVDANLADLDRVRGTAMAESAGLYFIALLLLDYPAYRFQILWRDEIRWLRELADRRQQIRNAS